MQTKDKKGQLLRLGDFVLAQIPVKQHATPLVGRIRSYASSGRIMVIFPMMTWDLDHHWFEPVDVELVYHPVAPDEQKTEKKVVKSSKVAV